MSRGREEDGVDDEEGSRTEEEDPVKNDDRLIPDDPWLLKGPEPESALVESVGTGPIAEL